MVPERILEEPLPVRVARIVDRIPRGKVTTYGRIALALGTPRGARMVGWVMNSMPGSGHPAHRVVNRHGVLTGAHAWGNPGIMRDLLEAEDVPFVDEWQVDLNACLWDPSDEPDLDDLAGSPSAPW